MPRRRPDPQVAQRRVRLAPRRVRQDQRQPRGRDQKDPANCLRPQDVPFLGAYVLIATEKWVTRTAAALGGAALVLALGISGADAAFFSEETGVDWNVVFLLLGMMIIRRGDA